jgi:predicted acylesterase/phospholipase RssA
MTIKHLVISGGGPSAIQTLSAIQELEEKQFLDIKNIESIYGTSAGAIIAVIIALKFDWETINDYIIKRPWQDVFPIKVQNILDAYTNKGLFDIKAFEKCFKPLFDAKDIPLDITLKDFYELTKIEINMMAFEINEYKIENISHLTYPNLSLLKAVQMSSALPVLISPVFIDDKCFMDGGIGCNYPLNFCIDSGKSPDEVVGFKNKYPDKRSNINNDSTILDYILHFLFKSVFNVQNNYVQPSIKNELICDVSYLSLDMLKNALSDIEARRELFKRGREFATVFLTNLQLQNSV